MKLAAIESFAVPDLPAMVWPMERASVAVPRWTTPVSALVTRFAEFASNTCSVEVGALYISLPFAFFTVATICNVGLLPWLAIVAYPRVMSSRLKPLLPSTVNGLDPSNDLFSTPALCAVCAIFLAPSLVCRSIYTVFEDCSVAVYRLTYPRFSPP